MCGIFCSICQLDNNNKNDVNKWKDCKDNVNKRGPDIQSECTKIICDKWKTIFAASVLWMQGKNPTTQPCIDDEENILLWNGDIFSGPLNDDHENSDTLTLMTQLKSSKNVIEVLKTIGGPFSI